jgi:glycosyltransferase involved in cell wall biosynthesis
VRVCVYTDYAYHRVEGKAFAERAFAIFISELARKVDRLIVVGRLHPGNGAARYPLEPAELVPLPYYPNLAQPLPAVQGMLRSLRRFWRALDDVDVVWLLGPHPLAFAFAFLAAARRRRVVLGVRQEFEAYVRNRHPGKRTFALAAWALERAFRGLARILPVVVVGPRLARDYSASRDLLEIAVSLIRPDEIVRPTDESGRNYDGVLKVLSVGRLDPEKNPLGLADVLSVLTAEERDWRLVVCGEGSMAQSLAAKLERMGIAGRAELLGYVPHDRLRELYRSSHALVQFSWTEGLPQVLFEGFAAGVPTVATDVGGIAEAAGRAVLLVPPGDAVAAARKLEMIAASAELRERLVRAGVDLARAQNLASETTRVRSFLSSSAPPRSGQNGGHRTCPAAKSVRDAPGELPPDHLRADQ